jgi:hypothetical protein
MMPEQLEITLAVIAMIQRGAMAQMVCVAAELRIAPICLMSADGGQLVIMFWLIDATID